MFKNHPVGLRVLFFTEMWERFGFYIMMAVFVLYMDNEFGWADRRKADFYGIFLGAVYFLPILGGWLGDRVLGHRNTIRIGAVLMVLGYIALAVSSADRLPAFYAGLILVSTGTGIFKSNMSVTVGALYESNPAIKDAGFNIYYMGVNVGAAIAPIAATIIHNVYGSYRISFGAAAAGMVVAITVFEWGKKLLPATDQRKVATNSAGPANDAVNKAEERQRLTALGILFLIVIFFWIAFYQNGFALTLFAQRATVVSDILKPETYQFFNPFFILVLTPVLVSFFGRLRSAEKGTAQRRQDFPGDVRFGILHAGDGLRFAGGRESGRQFNVAALAGGFLPRCDAGGDPCFADGTIVRHQGRARENARADDRVLVWRNRGGRLRLGVSGSFL